MLRLCVRLSASARAALFEDEKMNRLEEALSVFDSVVNNQVFAKTDMCATLAACSVCCQLTPAA